MRKRGEKPMTVAGDYAFGARLKPTREKVKFTQEQLASEMRERGFDFTQATIYKIENSKRKVTVAEALALSELLDVDLNALTAESDDDLAVYQNAIRNSAKLLYRKMRDASVEIAVTVEFLMELVSEIEQFELDQGKNTTLDFNGILTTPREFFAPLIKKADKVVSVNFDSVDNSESDFQIAEYLQLFGRADSN